MVQGLHYLLLWVLVLFQISFDGIERPLRDMAEETGAFIGIGSDVNSL